DLPSRTLATGIGRELRRVRNVKPLWARFGTVLGTLLAGIDMWTASLFRFSPFGTLRFKSADADSLWPVSSTGVRTYPRPDGTLTDARPSSGCLANIPHDADQPVQLRLRDPGVPIRVTLPNLGTEPAPRYCPAGVYEIATEGDQPVFRIHPA